MESRKIQMVDLVSQYHRLQGDIDEAMQDVIESASFINGDKVRKFAANMAEYLDAKYVIPCGNGTDALQIAMMRLELKPGDEVIVPAFTYAAAVEASILLGLKPVPVDVDSRTYNILPQLVEEAITEKTKAIIPVHLFGQSSDMYPLMETARRYNIYVIEDNAQSLGAVYTCPDGHSVKAGVMGDIGTLSFFPTKTLGCFGDGGAMITNNDTLAEELRKTTVHGQNAKYHHQIIGVNSRLDTLQAAILDVKLRHIDRFIAARRAVAAFYDETLKDIEGILLPFCHPSSTHVYNQYTIQISDNKRDELQTYLRNNGVPSTIYYPLSIDQQEAFAPYLRKSAPPVNSHFLSRSSLSIPMHTEMTEEQLIHIVKTIRKFFQ